MTNKNDKSQKNNISNANSLDKRSVEFPIVGIGASAGGLEALEHFFAKIPQDCGIAFVIIQHLDPNQVGIMPELIQRSTSLKVIQIKDNTKVQSNSIYVIPPKKSLSILKGTLHLFDPVEPQGFRLPIDIFFRSLADDMQEKAIGIILSGMGSDGSLGVKAIKENNGFVMIQDPSTAKFDGMPRSAGEVVVPDVVTPVEELPVKLLKYIKSPIKTLPSNKIEPKYKSNIEKIVILLREHTGHDFSSYKNNTLFRRIERRKAVHQINEINTYVRFLQENPSEIEILFKELLIGVTNFFRDAKVWDTLRNEIFPDLIKKSPNGHTLRAWIPACSTGEEAFSLAIIFTEAMEKFKNQKNITFQIFATDLDIDAIKKARRGVFTNNIVSAVSNERLNKHFIIENDKFRIKPNIREMVVFAPQNIIKDPPYTKLDILSCRNMLIYMEPKLQNKILALFNFSLNQDGILILGTSESLGKMSTDFKDIDSKLKIFQKNESSYSHELIDFPGSYKKSINESVKMKEPTSNTENIQTIIDKIVLQQFTPPSVLINHEGDIIYITGRTGKYLEPVAGKANWSIYAMAREGLREVLYGAIRRAIDDMEEIKIKNIMIGTNGGTQCINLTVKQLEKPDTVKGMILLVFQDVDEIIETKTAKISRKKQDKSSREKELEIELARNREDLQSLREEMQSSQEEQRSMNEEMQSTNEELQSTNEELTTSKEEMQSLNEELQTVNVELQSKVNDYLRANDDLKNLLNSTDIATLFLDKELNIRRFTDRVTKIFKIREEDIGRQFTDLVSDLTYPEIELHARQVLKTLTYIESAISTKDNRWFNIRIMPYRTIEDHIDGLVITFTDISTAKKLELELKRVNNELTESNR
jgi:two-component system CheB/CheR fusion protein